jgi:hypothetical protein
MKTKSPRPATLARAQAGLRAAYLRTFDCQSCDYKYNAQRNLQGRTHYVDEDTLKGFGSRILNSGNDQTGMVFWLIESVSTKPHDGKRNKRFVAFDLFGTVVNDRATLSTDEPGAWFRDSRAAEKACEAWLATFDAAAHTVAAMTAKAKRDATEAKRILSALRAKPVIA